MDDSSGLVVRRAASADVAAPVALAARVQARLTASGSLQRFGPIAEEAVAAYVGGGHAYALAAPDRALGGVFVRPETAISFPALARFGLDDPALGLWWLSKLMIEPDEQGRRLGDVLLAGALADVAARGAGTIGLDCWAGNHKLRAFYARAGFALRGAFAGGGDHVAVFTRRATLGQCPGGRQTTAVTRMSASRAPHSPRERGRG